LLLLTNVVEPVILYTSTPISTSYLFAIQSYTAQKPRGVAIFNVQRQALHLPPLAAIHIRYPPFWIRTSTFYPTKLKSLHYHL
jgi:hypothetical protein